MSDTTSHRKALNMTTRTYCDPCDRNVCAAEHGRPLQTDAPATRCSCCGITLELAAKVDA